jgi:predicted nuclease with TOPRIM domain
VFIVDVTRYVELIDRLDKLRGEFASICADITNIKASMRFHAQNLDRCISDLGKLESRFEHLCTRHENLMHSVQAISLKQNVNIDIEKINSVGNIGGDTNNKE